MDPVGDAEFIGASSRESIIYEVQDVVEVHSVGDTDDDNLCWAPVLSGQDPVAGIDGVLGFLSFSLDLGQALVVGRRLNAPQNWKLLNCSHCIITFLVCLKT